MSADVAMEASASLLIPAPVPGRTSLPLSRHSDERLARLVAGGSQAAFETLYERHHRALYGYCRALLRNDVDAQDALQSTLAAAYAALEREQRDAPLRPWLYRIAHNESISLLRRRRPHDELPELTDQGGSLHEQVERREQVAQLLEDLDELPDRQRQALLLRELNGLAYEEIAATLATSTGSIKRTIFDARQALSDFRVGRDTSCEEICRRISYADRRQLRGRRVRGHLRHCTSCAAFAGAIPARRQQLHGLVAPVPIASILSAAGRLAAGGSVSTSGLSAAGGAGGMLTSAAMTKVVGLVILAGTTVAVTTNLPRHTTPRWTAAPPVASSSAAASTLRTVRNATRSTAHASGARVANGRTIRVVQPSRTSARPSMPATPVSGAPHPARALRPAAAPSGARVVRVTSSVGTAAPAGLAVQAPAHGASTPGGTTNATPSGSQPVGVGGHARGAAQQPRTQQSGTAAPTSPGTASAAGAGPAPAPAPTSGGARPAQPGQLAVQAH